MTMPGLDLSADISATLGRMDAKLDRDEARAIRRREIARARVPQFVRIQGSGICPTPTAPFGINLGGPDPGFYWVVRRIVVGGLAWSTTAAGTAEVYVTGLAGAQGVASSGTGSVAGVRALADLVDQASALPNKALYGNGQIQVLANESLVVVVATGTQAQQYVASAGITVVRLTSDLGSEIDV